MGRKVRMVPSDWHHPRNDEGHYKPLHDGYNSAVAGFMAKLAKGGPQAALDWCGCPDINDYMPEWTLEEKTHYRMYENTTEGTPISPPFAIPEELAQWLADNKASSFGRMTATYEEWLATITGSGSAPSAIYSPDKGLRSGVEGLAEKEESPNTPKEAHGTGDTSDTD